MSVKPTTLQAYQLFHNGTLALARVEHNGARVDEDYLDRTITQTEEKVKEIQGRVFGTDEWKAWKALYKDRAELESVDQLREVLKALGYKSLTRTEKTGRDKWDKTSLEKLDTPFASMALELRRQSKTLSAFLLPIRRETKDGFVHCSYNLAGGFGGEEVGGASSYRSSCSMPNLQTIPKRNEEMEEVVQRCFRARSDKFLFGNFDFKTLEVRVGACYHKDPKMIAYINDPDTNMHRDGALDLFLMTREEYAKDPGYYDSTLRDSCKNQFTFAEFYGSVYFQCAPAIWDMMERRKFMVGDITLREHLRRKGVKSLGDCLPGERPGRGTFEYVVKQAEDKLWDRFRGYRRWREEWWQQYQNRGYFDLLTGFRCTGAMRRNKVLCDGIQGASFHCLLWVLAASQRQFLKRKMRSLVIGEVHDSLWTDTHVNEVEDVQRIIKRAATVELPKRWPWLIVPLAMDCEMSRPGGLMYEREKVKL